MIDLQARPSRTSNNLLAPIDYRELLRRLGSDDNDPRWSSATIEENLVRPLTGPTGSMAALLEAMYEILGENCDSLSVPAANFIRDVVIAIFTADRVEYQRIVWPRFEQELTGQSTQAQLYFALHAIPPEWLTPRSAAIILHGLEASPFQKEVHSALEP